VGFQIERMDLVKSTQAKATECANLLLLALYTLMPPGCGLEITLKLVREPLTITSPILAKKNLVVVNEVGAVTFQFQNYKTVKTCGADMPTLQVSTTLHNYKLTDLTDVMRYWCDRGKKYVH